MCSGAKIPAVYITITTSSVQSSCLCIIKRHVQTLIIKYTPLDWKTSNRITWIALYKLMANTVCMMCSFSSSFDGHRNFSTGTAYLCKIFISSRTNYIAVNWALVNAQNTAATKWLLLYGNSCTDRMLPYCWIRQD